MNNEKTVEKRTQGPKRGFEQENPISANEGDGKSGWQPGKHITGFSIEEGKMVIRYSEDASLARSVKRGSDECATGK